jgi:tetratricopeptide (TPR) repeat protein
MHEHRYRAFLCYSHRDSAWAEWLHHAIESFPIPPRLVGLETGAGVIPRKLAPVFRDRDELPSATNLSAKVSDALAQSASLVVICSPHAAQSHWVDEEVRTFQRLGRSDRIFCLIVDGEPGASRWAGRAHDECIPSALIHRIDAAGNETDEPLDPIAADARPGMDGRTNARTKLVAGLLGVDLDDLKHRERRRRRWNVTAGIAIGLAMLCLTTTLAVNAVIARHAAERRQKQAEDLVGFMLGDLDDKLRQVNRLDILESVGDRVATYFAELPSSDVTSDTLAQKARSLMKIGSVHRDQGRADEALASFNNALAASEQLVARDDSNSEYQLIRAESLTWIGFVDWSQGRIEQARLRFAGARDVLMQMSDAGARQDERFDRLATARTNLGQVFEAQGDLDGARVEFAAVLDIYSRLSRRDSEKLEWKAELGYAHKNLARIALADGRLEEAVREFAADRRIKASLAIVDSVNSERREDLAASNASLGWILYLSGETALAEKYLAEALRQQEELLAVDASSTDWIGEAGRYGWMSARIARAQGNTRAAAANADAALARLVNLTTRDPDNVGWRREWVLAGIEKSHCQSLQHESAAARTLLGSLRDAVARDSVDDRPSTLVAAQVDLALAEIASSNGKTEDMRANSRRVLDRIGSIAAHSSDPLVLDLAVQASLRLDRTDEARPMIALLAHIGYRAPDFVASLANAGVSYAPDEAVAIAIALIIRDENVTDNFRVSPP